MANPSVQMVTLAVNLSRAIMVVAHFLKLCAVVMGFIAAQTDTPALLQLELVKSNTDHVVRRLC